MTLHRWIPFKDLIFLQERMSRVFDEAMARYSGMDEASGSVWCPPLDIYETEDKVIVKVELPGVDIKDVDIEVKDNVMTLRGDRKFQRDVKEVHHHRMECCYGSFQRVFALTPVIDKDNLKAGLKDGVLEIILPKVGEDKTRHIKVGH